jgi:hypothetical protein
MRHHAALAPIPDQGTGRNEPELTETEEILGVGRQSSYQL